MYESANVLPVETRARLTNVLSITLISGLATVILDAWTGTAASIIAALLIPMTVLGASGSSAAVEIVTIASTEKAMHSIDLIRLVGSVCTCRDGAVQGVCFRGRIERLITFGHVPKIGADAKTDNGKTVIEGSNAQ